MFTKAKSGPTKYDENCIREGINVMFSTNYLVVERKQKRKR
jgi:hypothetical protein